MMGGGFLWTKPGIQNLRTCKRSPQKMTKEERRLWYDFLKQLPTAVNRQKVIGNYIVKIPVLEKDFHFSGSDWNGLITMVRADVNVPEREDVLRLLEKIVRLEKKNVTLLHPTAWKLEQP